MSITRNGWLVVVVVACVVFGGDTAAHAGGDCNGNGVPDADDISMGTSEDCDGNGVPDECDAEVTFATTGVSTLAGATMAVADLDGDGDLDVASASTVDGTFAWSENLSGDGSSWLDHPISSEVLPTVLLAADLDGDRDADLLAAAQEPISNTSNSLIVWFENLGGGGSFGPARTVYAADSSFALVAEDIDGDGDLDLVATTFGDDRVSWFENLDGRGNFGPLQLIWTQDFYLPRSVFAGDLDGDGDGDVVTASFYGEISWFENVDGDGTFGPEQVIALEVLDDGRLVTAADLDGDSDLDVVAVYDRSGELRIIWFENLDGSGTFGNEQAIEIEDASDFPLVIQPADMDGDGDVDLVVVIDPDLAGLQVSWYENIDGTGTFGPRRTIHSEVAIVAAAPADVDRDGDLDVVSGNQGGSGDCCTGTGGAPGCEDPVCENAVCNLDFACCAISWDGFCIDLALETPGCVCEGIKWHPNESRDCNGNGTPDECDVATAFSLDCDGAGVPDECELATGAAADCNGNGVPDGCDIAGGSSGDCDGNGVADECEPDCDLNGTTDACDIAAGADDVDGNGIPDVCEPDCNGNVVPDGSDIDTGTSEDCNGNGIPDECDLASGSDDCDLGGIPDECETSARFTIQTISLDLQAYEALGVAAADLDGDGDVDALSASKGDDKIAWYENLDGAGTFGVQKLISKDVNGADDVLAVDLDGDGDLDVISVSNFDDKIAWYENFDLGAGVIFGSQQIITTAADFPVSVSPGDLDGDGDLDLVSASIQDDEVAWYENLDGDGTFGPQQIVWNLAPSPADVFAADLDGDGDLDILVAFSALAETDELGWFENVNGTGFFGPLRIISAVVDAPLAVAAADVDGDGDLDVLSATRGDQTLAWYENVDGSGSFGSRRIVSQQGSGLNSFTTGDLDGDGTLDVVATFGGSDRVGWYANLGAAFAPERPVAQLDAPVEVALADVDGDGILDVLTVTVSDLGNSNCCVVHSGPGCSDAACYELVCAQDPFCCGEPFGWTNQCVQAALAEPACVAACNDGTLGTVAWHRNESLDCDANGVPDGCDLDSGAEDCNANTVLDACEPDCNGNGLADDCDIAGGSSQDCNADGVPDECEPDCNGNGVADVCDIAGGGSRDCDADGVPDECVPDCNNNGEADSCDILAGTSQDCDTNGVPDECDPDCNGSGQPDLCDVLGGGSDDCNGNFHPDECDLASGASEDCTGNGVPDECEPDCNANGVADSCDVALGGDCDADGVPDECELGVFFMERTVVESPGDSWIPWPADIDGDGDVDVVTQRFSPDELAWQENIDGLGTFTPRVIATGTTGLASRTADLDGDGDLDVILPTSTGITRFENLDGAGSFGLQQTIVTGVDVPYDIVPVDMDGDGDIDILTATLDLDEIAWQENVDGTGLNWSKHVISAAINAPGTVAGVDIDADGDTDVLTESNDDGLVLFRNLDGAGGSWQTEIVAPDVTTGNLQPFDLDGDGDPDVIYTENGLAWRENLDGAGTLGPRRDIVIPFFNVSFFDLGDLDGDGDLDVAGGRVTSDRVFWAEHLDGIGDFGSEQIVSEEVDAPNVIFVVDINGDAKLDLLTETNNDGPLPGAVVWFENVSQDCNGNGIVDACEPDCNANGIADACDLRLETSRDCDANGSPDECDTACVSGCDADGDGCVDDVDTDPGNPTVCADSDQDGCDDCSGGTFDPASDGANSDTDGICDAGDCDPADNRIWRAPGPTGTLLLGEAGVDTVLDWLPPTSPGSIVLRYDTLGSADGSDFVGAGICLESDGTDTTSADVVLPGSGSVRYFLIRAVNDCPAGDGSLGTNSAGVTRSGVACP